MSINPFIYFSSIERVNYRCILLEVLTFFFRPIAVIPVMWSSINFELNGLEIYVTHIPLTSVGFDTLTSVRCSLNVSMRDTTFYSHWCRRPVKPHFDWQAKSLSADVTRIIWKITRYERDICRSNESLRGFLCVTISFFEVWNKIIAHCNRLLFLN